MKYQGEHYYLITVQYLGFRFHGWQRQPEVKTIQKMIEKTLSYVFDHQDFKILGAGRTDAMVSATGSAFELFVKEKLNEQEFLTDFNKNLPNDIRATKIGEVSNHFNVIQDSVEKEYHYLFSFGEKFHPFCAPLMTYIPDSLNVELMMEGARLFEGKHDFKKFCYKPSQDVNTVREIVISRIEENSHYTASFFPDKSYLYIVKGNGFMRHQIRLMIAALFALGAGKISLPDIETSLVNTKGEWLAPMAPKSGLILHNITFDPSKLQK